MKIKGFHIDSPPLSLSPKQINTHRSLLSPFFSSHASFDLFNSSGNLDKVLDTIFLHIEIILNSDTTNMLVLIEFVPVDIVLEFRVISGLLLTEINKVTTRFNCNTHTSLDLSSSSEVLDAEFGGSLGVARQISSDIMDLSSDHMTQTMGEEETSDSLLSEFIEILILDNTKLDQVLDDSSLSQQVKIIILGSWLQVLLDNLICLKNSIVDGGLLLSELAICGESGGDITAVAIVFEAQIAKNQVSVLDKGIVLLVM
mmetsp:Transcript_36425/g.32695  ORF Transcript_36425/g.32695 Transcript_36425/m.32695 type:complete len:257 (-) Transcript_36425:816-1586(-)